MSMTCNLRISRRDYSRLWDHLFPGDDDEHGAVLLAGVSRINGRLTLHVREVHDAHEGTDYVEGRFGYRALHPTFIHRLITRARDQRLAYLAVHNHHTDHFVDFSQIDMDSHERGYPALLQIGRGIPVGALVFGRSCIQADVWEQDGSRHSIEQATIIGQTLKSLTSSVSLSNSSLASETYERQVRMFGVAGQTKLRKSHIAVVGLGGIGSLVCEYLARLGVGRFTLVDPDRVEESNLSRIVGAATSDAQGRTPKTLVAQRLIQVGNPTARIHLIADDVAKESVARQLRGADYIFLAADSMRARLVFNAIVHQYLIPGVQLGSKIRQDATGTLLDILSVNRPVRPGEGCLWCNQLVDPTQLANESKTDSDRAMQAYGVREPNPSVISLNAVGAAHAVNDFLLDFLTLRPEPDAVYYEHFDFLKRSVSSVRPRRDAHCTECSPTGRYGRGDGVPLPCIEG